MFGLASFDQYEKMAIAALPQEASKYYQVLSSPLKSKKKTLKYNLIKLPLTCAAEAYEGLKASHIAKKALLVASVAFGILYFVSKLIDYYAGFSTNWVEVNARPSWHDLSTCSCIQGSSNWCPAYFNMHCRLYKCQHLPIISRAAYEQLYLLKCIAGCAALILYAASPIAFFCISKNSFPKMKNRFSTEIIDVHKEIKAKQIKLANTLKDCIAVLLAGRGQNPDVIQLIIVKRLDMHGL